MFFLKPKRLGPQARVGANRRKAAALRRRHIAVDGEKKTCFPPQGSALRRIRGSPQTLPIYFGSVLPSAPDRLLFIPCTRMKPASEVLAVAECNLILFPRLPLR